MQKRPEIYSIDIFTNPKSRNFEQDKEQFVFKSVQNFLLTSFIFQISIKFVSWLNFWVNFVSNFLGIKLLPHLYSETLTCSKK